MTPLVEERAAFAARSWGKAYRKLAEADDEFALELGDLEQLALAAYLSGRNGAATDAWTRAHHEALRRGDRQRAARAGISILSGLIFRGDVHPGMGWLARVARVVVDCDRCAEHAWIDVWNAFPRMFGGDPGGAEPTFAGLTEDQRTDVIRVLDGMIRERSDGNGPAVLTAPLNIGLILAGVAGGVVLDLRRRGVIRATRVSRARRYPCTRAVAR